jgi:hypothetical protein
VCTIQFCLRGSRPWVLIAALVLCAGPALPASIIAPFQDQNTASEISQIENYLAANYGIYLNFLDTPPQNLELIEDLYGALLPNLEQSFPSTNADQTGNQSNNNQPPESLAPETGTLELLCWALVFSALAALTVRFHVPLRCAHRSIRNRLHPEA